MIAANSNTPAGQDGIAYAREWRRRNKPIFDQAAAAGAFADVPALGWPARAIGFVLAAVATLLAMLACTDPDRLGSTAIVAAMLLYAGSATAFFRADNQIDAGGAGGWHP